MFPKGSPFLPDVSRAVLNVTEGKLFEALEKELYGDGISLDRGFDVASSSLQLSNFWGLFIVTGTASGGALLLFLVTFFFNNPKVDSILRSENSPLGKLLLLLKLFNEKDARRGEPETRGGEEMRDLRGGGGGSGAAAENPNSIFNQLQSPSSMSNHTYGNGYDDDDAAGTPSEGDETPGREISGGDTENFSFSRPLSPRGMILQE